MFLDETYYIIILLETWYDEADGIQQMIFAGMVLVLLQQLVNIPFRYWTRQHTVFWVSASRHTSPADEYYWEYGMKLDDLCHSVKHLRRNKMSAMVNLMLKRTPVWTSSCPLTSFDRCPVPRAYWLVLWMNRIFTL